MNLTLQAPLLLWLKDTAVKTNVLTLAIHPFYSDIVIEKSAIKDCAQKLMARYNLMSKSFVKSKSF